MSHGDDTTVKHAVVRDESSTTKEVAITDHSKVKTDMRTIIGVVFALVMGAGTVTGLYLSMVSKMENMVATSARNFELLGHKIDAATQATDRKIDYLYHVTNTYNPFERDADASLTVPVPRPPIQPAP